MISKIVEELNRRLTRKETGWAKVIPPVICEDGGKISVQASRTHYCEPRSDIGPYSRVEVGFPEGIPEVEQWSDWEDSPGDVWGYVPIEEVAKAILAHGGFSKEA